MKTLVRIVSFVGALAFAGVLNAQPVTFIDEVFKVDAEQPAHGAWLGNVTLPNNDGEAVFVALVIESSEEGTDTATMTLLPAGALNKEMNLVVVDDGAVTLILVGAGGSYRFTGAVDETGQRLRGEVALVADGEVQGESTTFEFARTPRPLDLSPPFAFTGKLKVQSAAIGMSIVLAQTPGGHWVGQLDVPMQFLNAFPIINLIETDGVITGEVPVPGGASIEVSLDAARQRMTGVFLQGGLRLAVDFARDSNYAYQSIERPQEPKPPFPYESREIVVEHPAGFQIAGTLTIPDSSRYGPGPYPVAIMISGSGQQDRDESLMGHKPFLVIADHLTRAGIAVMRYDDRGIGGTGGLDTLEAATSEDFATDTLAVLNHLQTLDMVDGSRIGLIGHSEGGMIAPLVGTMTDDVAFMVLLAGPGVRGEELLAVQRRLLSKAVGIDEKALDEQEEVMAEIIAMAIEGADEEALLEHAVRRARELDPDLNLTDDQLRTSMRGQFSRLTSSWMRYFLSYEPAPALRRVTCPVFALNGTKDLQVWHEQNLDAIASIMAGTGVDFTAKRYEGLNHLFQPCETGAVPEYAQIETTIAPEVLDDLATWIASKVK